jgi:N-acetylneuraminic acid mutarotase
LTSVQAYNPATDTWTIKSSDQKPRIGLGAGVINGLLYAVGGFDARDLRSVAAYDPSTNAWTAEAPMLGPRGSLAVGVAQRTLYAVGGHNPQHGYLKTLEAFNP